MSLLRLGLISDTHGRVHRDVHTHFAGVQAILHAGDVGGADVIAELETIAPLHAVRGNVDGDGEGLRPAERVPFAFGSVGIRHGHEDPSEPKAKADSLLRHFADPAIRLILTGHSHLQSLDYRRGVWIVNPGSAGRPRLNTVASLCVLEWNSAADAFSFCFHQLS
jgi:putative phosphoesterase